MPLENMSTICTYILSFYTWIWRMELLNIKERLNYMEVRSHDWCAFVYVGQCNGRLSLL